MGVVSIKGPELRQLETSLPADRTYRDKARKLEYLSNKQPQRRLSPEDSP